MMSYLAISFLIPLLGWLYPTPHDAELGKRPAGAGTELHYGTGGGTASSECFQFNGRHVTADDGEVYLNLNDINKILDKYGMDPVSISQS